MNSNDLKKLSKLQLLEMLLMQTKRVEELELQLKEKNSQLLDLQKQLEEKPMKFEDVGTLAQAALQMYDVFRQADKAAAQYLDQVKQFSEDVNNLAIKRSLAAKKEIEDSINKAHSQADKIIADAQKQRKDIIDEAKKNK